MISPGTLCSDILAIRCINKYVCIGRGNFIDVYEIKNRKSVARLKVFENNNVHGIVEGSGDNLFVYGSKNLGICRFTVSDNDVKLSLDSVKYFCDWIITLDWSQTEYTTLLSILFAHNNLCFYNTDNKTTRTLWCEEKCILYGGSLLAKTNGITIVFSGTVFQEILIWKAQNDKEYSNDVPILHRLKGHKGVIFSVNFYTPLNIITSTSDDRTVRLWRVNNKNIDGENLEEKENMEVRWENCSIDLTTTMYGHTARVWRSVVSDEKIFTIGEDSFLCVWSLDGKLLDKMEIHDGAEIWSIVVSEDNELIFTGGADGAVKVWDLDRKNIFDVDLIYSSDKTRLPKFVFYSNYGRIIFFMDGGYLDCYDPSTKSFQTKVSLPRYSNYCVMQISPDRDKICLASKDGHINIFKEFNDEKKWRLSSILDLKISECKIFSVHWLDNKKIIACCESGRLKIINEIEENGKISLFSGTFILPKSRERWTTAAIIESHFLICGDRAGNIYVYDTRFESNSSPIQTFPKIHGRLGVQSFSIVSQKLLSTGRDGTVRHYEFDDKNNEIRALHFIKMPMDWVCRILETNDDLYVLGFKEVEFIVYSTSLKRIIQRYDCGGGHRSWDCKVLEKKLHFAYIRDKKIYESRKKLGNTDRPILEGFHTREVHSVHFFETSSRHAIFVSASEDCTLRLASVVEVKSKDLTMKKSVNSIMPKIRNFSINTLDSYDGHISNVKSLAILNLEKNENWTKNLVFSGGGRAQLKIWEMKIATGGKSVTRNDVACKELFSYMVRGTDLDRRRNWQSARAAFFEDPEARLMDIKADFHRGNKNLVVLFVACSDGFTRIFLYDIYHNNLQTSNFVNYCDRCVLRVNHFQFGDESIFMTMSTDGIVRFWRTNDAVEDLVKSKISCEILKTDIDANNSPFSQIKIHQSGINCFDLRKIDDYRFLLLTGGDDNLISLVVIEISMKDCQISASKVSSWNSSSIHSAQITGAKFMDGNRILTTGIDQLVVTFLYSYSNGRLTVSKTEEITTLVSDVQGVALNKTVFGNDDILACVYGKGIEIMVVSS